METSVQQERERIAMNQNIKFKTLIFTVFTFLLGCHEIVCAQNNSGCFQFRLGTVTHIIVPDTIVDSVAFVSFNTGITDSSVLPHSLTIPGTVKVGDNSYNVVVEEDGFKNCNWIEDVVMEEGVVCIHANAFNGCSNLRSVFIPKSVDRIHHTAFRNTTNLSTIKISEENEHYDSRDNCNAVIAGSLLEIGCKGTRIPDNVQVIDKEAFYGCLGLDSIYIPDGVTQIQGDAFAGCANLKKVRLSENLSKIIGFAFKSCTSLEEIYIPASVNLITSNPFAGCSGLRKIVVDNHNTVYDSRKSCNAIIETKRSRMLSTCKSTVIPESVKEYSWCFAYMPIKEIHVSKNVTFIAPYAFEGCSELEQITVDKRNKVYDSRKDCNAVVQKNGNILIAGCYNTRIPSDIVEIGPGAFSGRTLRTDFEILQNVQRIMNGAFSDCSGLKHARIPYTLYYLGDGVFTNCKDLQSAEIEALINEIPPRTFQGCTKLEDIDISYSVRIIGKDAFKGCEMLRNISIKSNCGVEIVDEGAFDGCPSRIEPSAKF